MCQPIRSTVEQAVLWLLTWFALLYYFLTPEVPSHLHELEEAVLGAVISIRRHSSKYNIVMYRSEVSRVK